MLFRSPLTPMKLSAQHLEKAWDDKAPGWDKKLKQFTQTLIQQIDTLSSIASGFSDFATMPKTKKEVISLRELIENAIDLYKDTTGVTINFVVEGSLKQKSDKCLILADNEQMLRVLNNLLNNAIQSIPESREGIIDVELSKDGNNYNIKLADNGTGIPADEKDKIFSPSFTTKSGGMGLGLAIVKNIVENSGGKVWFRSEEDVGSTFYVSLPAHEKQ